MKSQPHPATYILFRPPAASMTDEDDEQVFQTDIDLTCPRKVNYKKSCPALLGTASRKLHSVDEDELSAASDSSDADERGLPPLDLMLESTQPLRLNKKRSFLLVDVLDSVEGRQEAKRHDNHETSSTFSTDSIEIEHSTGRSQRRIKRQRSNFDLLYANSRTSTHARGTPRTKACDPVCNTAPLPLHDLETLANDSGSSTRLRSKKSMLTLSLERLATEPSRSRLDVMDTHQLTSFDAVLQDCNDLKAEQAGNVVDFSTTMRPLASTTYRLNKIADAKPIASTKFARHTELLKQMPDISTKPRKVKPLRHAKSAKDILEKYRIDAEKRNRSGLSEKRPPGVTQLPPREEPASMQRASLRSNLRALLGMRKRG